MYLRGKDLTLYSDFVHSLYVPQTEDSLRQTIVQGLSKLIPGENIAASAFDFQTRKIVSTTSQHGLATPFFYDALATFIADHPLGHTLIEPPIQGGSVLSDHVSVARWHRTATYNEVFRPEGFNDQLSIEISRPSPHLLPTGIAVFRYRQGFSHKDRALMALVHAHIKQAFDNMSQGNLSAILQMLESQASSSAGDGMVLLNPHKQIIHCSEATRSLLADFFPPGLQRMDRLPVELETLLEPSSRHSFTKTKRGEMLEIRSYQDMTGQYLLTVRASGPISARARLVLLGLSPREAEVLYWIAQGKRNEEIAIILGISFFTIKNHLKRIFHILGVETRSAATAIAARHL